MVVLTKVRVRLARGVAPGTGRARDGRESTESAAPCHVQTPVGIGLRSLCPVPEERSFVDAYGIDVFSRWWMVDEPRGLLLVSHGASEHCGRYDRFAER